MRAAYVVGVGVTSTATAGELANAFDAALAILGIDRSAIGSVATRIELVADHRIVALGLPVLGFRSEELSTVGVPSPSTRVADAVSTLSVAEAAALLGAFQVCGAPAVLVLPKQRSVGVTVAVACLASDVPRSASGDELVRALDVSRATVVDKVAGLDLAMATRHRMPSGVTLLGIVKHLVWVERGWFDNLIAGNEFNGCESDVSFQLEDTETVESVVADYLNECARSRSVVANRSFDDLTVVPHWFFGVVDVRWVHIHMIRETARHLGHMDILRELTDGATGF